MVWRRLSKAGACALLGLGGMLAEGKVQAQPSVVNSAPFATSAPRIFAKQTRFEIPVEIGDAIRGNLREVCLYVKVGADEWMRQDAQLPNVTKFAFTAPQDGEYSFSIVTTDRAGKPNPPDLKRLTPQLQVVVDTQKPELDLQQTVAEDGEFCLKCVIRDANPNYESLQMTYRTSDGQDHVINAIQNRPGMFRLPLETFDHPVLVKGKDMAGNENVRDCLVKNPLPGGNRPAAASEPISAAPKVESPMIASAPMNPPAFTSAQVPPPATSAAPVNPAVYKNEPAPFQAGPTHDWKGQEHVVESGPTDRPPPYSPAGMTEVSRHGLEAAPANRRLIKDLKASLEYSIEKVGPSGISKVEVYATSDQGANWQRLGEDPDRRSPVEVTLPGEGVYGIRLVLTNGNGFGGTPPTRGDQPTSYIEVDATAPNVSLSDIDPTARNGCLEIHWKASDKNLGSEPVTLFYRTRPEMPWTVLARNIKNDGMFRWAFPRDMGPQFFVRMEVVDQAGNVGRIECPNPVTLDMIVPSAAVVNISGLQRP